MFLKLLLVLSLLGFAPKPNTNPKSEINYVSLGASQTTGYGLHGFIPEQLYSKPTAIYEGGRDRDGYYSSGYYYHSMKSYPELIKAKLEEEYTTVNFYQGAMNSMRAYDLACLLDETVEKDEYFNWRLGDNHGWIEDIEKARDEIVNGGRFVKGETNLIEELKTNISEADFISYDFGINDFGVYLPNIIISYFTEDDGPMFDADLKKTLGEELFGVIDVVGNLVKDNILLDLIDLDADLVSKVSFVGTALTYALSTFIYGFESSMKSIYALNPDVEIVVVALQNIVRDYKVKVEGITIDLGSIAGVAISFANYYMSHMSKYSSKYYFADFGTKGRVTNFADEIIAWDGEFSTLGQNMIDLANAYDENFLASTIAGKYVDNNATTIKSTFELTDSDLPAIKERITNYFVFCLANLSKHSLKDVVIDVADVDFDKIEEFKTIVTHEDYLKTLIQNYKSSSSDDGLYNFIASTIITKLENSAMKSSCSAALILSYGNSFFSHPNEAGHEEMANAIYDSFKDKKAAKYEEILTLIDFERAIANKVVELIKATVENMIKVAEKVLAEIVDGALRLKNYTLAQLTNLSNSIKDVKSYITSLYENVLTGLENLKDVDFTAFFTEQIAKLDAIQAEIDTRIQASQTRINGLVNRLGELFHLLGF